MDNITRLPVTSPASPELARMQEQIDERDDIIKRLNEALARALDELDLEEAA